MIIGPDEFMAVAFPDLDLTNEMSAISRPIQGKDGKWVFPAEPYFPGRIQPGMAWFFNITTFKPAEDGDRFFARLPLAVSTRVIVLDDIGDHPKSKISWDAFINRAPLPHYVLATREEHGEANCQIGYFIEPSDPDQAGQLIEALIKAGLTDPGMRSANRWARLPGSTKHGGTYVARLLEWDPPRTAP
ncbi:hypothetical protein SAMN02990966_07920 [Rhodospirillales bacterium URHD0017]|nr:hypothetical protein SAMN02990966_07920 [Rhodospirillales bacterium URHD0017]